MTNSRSSRTDRYRPPPRFEDAESRGYRRKYLIRLSIGVATLVLLAVPAILHSHAAMQGLMNRPPEWLPDTLAEKADFNRFVDRFDVTEIVMVSWPGARLDNLGELDGVAEALRRLSQRMPGDRSPDDESAEPPIDWVRTGNDFLTSMTSEPASFPRRAAVRRLQGALLGPDGNQTCLVIEISNTGSLNRRALLPQIRETVATTANVEPDAIAMVGGPVDGATVDAASIRSVEVFAPPSAIIAILLCFFCLRSVPLTAVIVAIAVISEGLVMAAVYYSGTPMNAVLIVLPPLVFVLTISSGIHLSNYYLDAVHEFADLTPSMAAKCAMRAGTVPCMLAAGTTIIGLGSLSIVRLEPIRIFGVVAAIGVAVSLSLLLWCLPGAMVLTRRPLDKAPGSSGLQKTNRRVRRGFQAFLRARLIQPWPMIVGFGLITIGAAWGLPKLESSVSVPRMFMADSDIRRQHDWFEANVGATVTGDLLVSFPKQDDGTELVDPIDQLRVVQNIQRALMKHPRVDSVLSAASFVPPIKTGRGLSASASRSLARSLIRDPQSSLGQLGFISHGDGSDSLPDDLWRLSFRLPQKIESDHGEDLSGLQAVADESLRVAISDEAIDSDVSQRISARITGHVSIVQKAQEVMLADLFRSFLTAFGVVAVVMVLLLKNLRGGLIAMIPNLFPTVTIFGLMGLLSRPLDIGSVMTASVALGIAVDDTIHLLSRFGSRRARGLGRVRATFGAIDQCGWAMLQTTLVCGVALLVYWFSDFVPTSNFAVLMFTLLAAALLGDVFLLPALMSSPFGKYLSRSVGVDPGATLTAEQADEPPSPKRRPTIDARETVAGGR